MGSKTGRPRPKARSGKRVAAIVLAGLAVAGAVFFVYLWRTGDDGAAQRDSAPRNAAEVLVGGPTELLYQYDTELFATDVSGGKKKKPPTGKPIAKLGSEPVLAAPGSYWLAHIDHTPKGPELRVIDPRSGDKHDLGFGIAATWNADGTKLAYLRPEEAKGCRTGNCEGDKQLVVVDLAGGGPDETGGRALLDPTDWRIIDWAGDRILLSDESTGDRTVSVSLDGDFTTLAVSPGRIMSVSPDGRWLITGPVDPDPVTEFVALEGGELGRREVLIEINENKQNLNDTAWSHDSKQVLAVLREGTDGKLVMLSPERPAPMPFEDAPGEPVARLMWSPDNRSISYERINEEGKRAALEQLYCPANDMSECRTLLRWETAVTPLRIQ